MAGEAASVLLTIQAIQSVLRSFQSTLNFGSYLCPLDSPIHTIANKKFDFIIVGSGTAGSVLANRLSECPSTSVLLLETGGCPPIESLMAGLFALIPNSTYDYKIKAVDDKFSHQNIRGKAPSYDIGKMLGGSSSLHHLIHVSGSPKDYDAWGEIAAKSSTATKRKNVSRDEASNYSDWSYENLLPFAKKSENLKDKEIAEKYADYHGFNGPIITQRQLYRIDEGYLKAFEEIGYKIRSDTNNYDPLGVVETLLDVGVIRETNLKNFPLGGKYRQSGLVSYIYPAKDRPNLHVLTNATVEKILFNKQTAVGVRVSYNGSSVVFYSNKEVIISAGAIKTPQLLMISGIGPAEHLKSKGIRVIADLPVGKNLHDQVGGVVVFAMDHDSSPTPRTVPTEFPGPSTCGYANLDNKTADVAQCQNINLVFYQNSQDLMLLCLNVFKYEVHICQKWYEANVNRRTLVSIVVLLYPESKGELLLNTTNIDDPPIGKLGYFSNKNDLVTLGRCIANTARLTKTEYFKKAGAEFYDLGVCKGYKNDSAVYFQCLARALSTTLWHYSGTASLGSVIDARLRVKGVNKLRVVDASIMPRLVGGNINTAVVTIGEKGAGLIMEDYKCESKNYCQ